VPSTPAGLAQEGERTQLREPIMDSAGDDHAPRPFLAMAVFSLRKPSGCPIPSGVGDVEDHPIEASPLDTRQGTLGGLKRREAPYGMGAPLDRSMVLFHHMIAVVSPATSDRDAVGFVVIPDGGCSGRHLPVGDRT
jgi:hypothetical protein